MRAYDLMTPDPRVVTGDESIRYAARMMRELDVGFIPVVDDRAHMHLRGVVTDRDIAIRCAAEGLPTDHPVEEIMTATPLTIGEPDWPVNDVIRTMEQAQVRRLPVVSDGRLIGVIAQADIALKEGPMEPLMVEELLERVSSPLPFSA